MLPNTTPKSKTGRRERRERSDRSEQPGFGFSGGARCSISLAWERCFGCFANFRILWFLEGGVGVVLARIIKGWVGAVHFCEILLFPTQTVFCFADTAVLWGFFLGREGWGLSSGLILWAGEGAVHF